MAPDNNDSGSSTPSASETRTLFSRSVANPQLVKHVPHNFTTADAPIAQTANDGDFRETTFYHARRQRPNSGTQDGDDDAGASNNFEPAQVPLRSTTKHATKTKTRRTTYMRVGGYTLTDSSSADSEDESSDDATRSQQADRPGPSGVAATRTDGSQRQRAEQPAAVMNMQQPNSTTTTTTRNEGSEPTAVTNKNSVAFDNRAVPRSSHCTAFASNETQEASSFHGDLTAHATTEVPGSRRTDFGSRTVTSSSRPETTNTNDVAGTANARQPAAQLSSRDSVADAEVEQVMGQVGHGERFLRHSVQRSQQSQAAAAAPQPPRTASAASGRSSTSIFNRSGNNILKRLSFVESASRPLALDAGSTSQRRPSSPHPTDTRAAASNDASVEDDDSDETGFENVPADYRPASSMSSRPPSVMRRPVVLPTFGEPEYTIYTDDESATRTARTYAAPSTQADDGEDSDETGFEHVPPFKPKSGSHPLPSSSSGSSGGRYGDVRGCANDSARPSQSGSNLQEPASSQRPHSVTTVRASVAPPAGTFPRRSASQMQARLPTPSVGIEKLEEYRRIIRGILRLRHPDMMLVRDLEGVLHGMEFCRTDLQVRLGMPLREFVVTVPDVDLLTMGEHNYCVYRPPDNAS